MRIEIRFKLSPRLCVFQSNKEMLEYNIYIVAPPGRGNSR